ncbi:hypothetical protein AAZX31_11G206500 [Glycine max]
MELVLLMNNQVLKEGSINKIDRQIICHYLCRFVGPLNQHILDDGEITISTMPGSISKTQPTIFTNVDATANSCRFEEAKAGAPLCCQIETSPKIYSTNVCWEYSEFSVMDLFCGDEPNTAAEKCPTCEDHVSFSLEGLGKVGTETPVHSPEQRASYSPMQKDGRKSKLKKLSHELNDIELEVDTMMQDIKVSPICSSDYPFNKVRRSLAIVGNDKHFYDHNSVSEEFFNKTKNSDENLLYEIITNNKTFQMGSKSPELLKSVAYKMENYAFKDLLPKKWYLLKMIGNSEMFGVKRCPPIITHFAYLQAKLRIFKLLIEPHSSFSKSDLENDLDFYVASRSRLGGNFNAQNLIPEDVKDKSSLLRYNHNSPVFHCNCYKTKKKNAFASTRNKYSTKDEKCRSMPNSSKQMPSHYSNSTLQEELGAHNSWQFEERNPSVDKSSVAAPFCLDLEADFAVFGSKNKIVDPFSVFTTPELSNKVKASPSSGGFKKAAPLADSPPCSFTSEKFAFDCSTAFPNVGSWPTSPRLSPDFQTKGKKSEDKTCPQKRKCQNMLHLPKIISKDNNTYIFFLLAWWLGQHSQMKFWSPEGRTTMRGGKHKNDKVFQLMRVQMVLKEACT